MKPENSARDLHPQAARGNAGRAKSLTLSLEVRHCGRAVVLHCQGRLIFQNEARTLSALVSEVLPSARRMIIDLSAVESIDSAGLGELVLTHMWAEAAGLELKFASPRKSLRQLFELTNLVSVFDLYSSVPEAMAAMRQGQVQSA
ncbi:MAG: STAS domain-containing protein [Acidobacteriia bacterium]|nr:STAS domain-containing protein [Terriglobia bacterium]